MPQISKVRIVNFTYNDGKRLIADELYDFASQDKDDALNVLINLANGGGKSVLVQLMMQPMVPKARVAGRKIESFFNKAGDHCFVLLEWIKDNSPEKLLTGIAMAAGESIAAEDDSTRGMSVKYYTFYSNYAAYTSAYDIVNMPLSQKENGRFVPADYDAVRVLARKSNGVLNYYMADDSSKWQKKLSEYGIMDSEWRMIVRLNSEEGGLSKFFGEFKSSDQLVDKLLIPTIESKLTQMQSREDSSLSTMLISYAKQYATKQEVIREKKTYESFEKELSLLSPQAEALWNAYDALEICIRELFGFSDALTAKLDECRAMQEACEAEIVQLDQQATRIEHERASLTFYHAKETFEQAERKYIEASTTERELQDQRNEAAHRKLVLECAEYYQKLLRVEGELAAIHSEITRRENGGDNGEKIAELKYSVYVQIRSLLASHLPEAERLDTQREVLAAQKSSCEKELTKSAGRVSVSRDAFIRADGSLSYAIAETDRAVESCGIDAIRMLDGSYAMDEIVAFKNERTREKGALEDGLAKLKEKLAGIEEEISVIPQKKAELTVQRAEKDRTYRSSCEDLDAYYAADAKIKDICSEYNLDPARRFTDYPKEQLLSEERRNQARQAELLRKISNADEEIRSAKRGSLHVPYAVIEYLNSTGVRYSTCEKYLTEQVSAGKLTNEACLLVLQNYPAAAFGVLMDAEEKEKFFAYGREKWLPAMIPLYTYDQMTLILSNAKKHDGSIAFYSEEYFQNVTGFIEDLEKNQQTLYGERDLAFSIGEKIKAQLESLRAFDYTDSYEKEQKAVIAGLKKAIWEMEGKIQALNGRETELRNDREALQNSIQKQGESIERINRILEGIEAVTNRMAEEQAREAEKNTKKQSLEDAEQEHREIQSRFKALQSRLIQAEEALATLKDQISELNTIRDQIGACEQTEIADGDWRTLLSEYQSLQSSLNRELSDLKSRLESMCSQKKEYADEIETREIIFDEYSRTVFSSEQLVSVRKAEKALQSALNDARSDTSCALEQKGKAEGKLDSAEQALGRFGDLLERSEVGGDFDARLKTVREQKQARVLQRDRSSKLENSVNHTCGRINDRLKKHSRPDRVVKIRLEEALGDQFTAMIRAYEDAKERLERTNKLVSDALYAMRSRFAGSTCGVSDAIERMITLLANDLRGDRYYTLVEHINGDRDNTAKAIAQIMTDLEEFENNRNDLIRQCVLQGERIYEGLTHMASSSRVTVYDGRDKKQMIRFDIPAEVDAVVAHAAVTDEIDKGTKELVSRMSDETTTEADIRKMADKLVGSKNLLRKYIGKEAIRVDAYKIDQNPQNAGYRSWEQTQVNNSGAEKFVVYFAVILSLMNYTRGDFGGIRDKDMRSALILDNPFGATSSKHILIPMFAISKHFHVQMICLSDINKSDVINCFDIVIKAIVKKRPMSNHELLTHEGNETIEHGFYRSEQLRLNMLG